MLEANWLDEVLESLNEERVTPCHPVSPQEKQPGDKIADPETRMNKGSSNSVTPVTPENDKFEKKSADILELELEERREKVLAILEERPEIQRAFVTDIESDPDNAIITLAIRDVGTCELLIPKQKYDPFLLLELIQNGKVQ